MPATKGWTFSGPNRAPQLPDVPTFRELGFPQLEAVAWMGLWSAPEVPADVQARVRAATLTALADPAMRTRMLDTGFDCPEVVNLVFARFTRSAILYQQMRGRGTRKARCTGS